MSAVTALRLAWLVALAAAIALVALGWRARSADVFAAPQRGRSATVRLVTSSDGQRGVVDAGGHVVPLRDYRRIASASALADELLLALAEPERIIALTRHGREQSSQAHMYGARMTLLGPDDVDTLREQRIDLVLVHHYGSPAELARARETGAQVFNLGEMRGLTTLDANLETIALLLGERERGAQLWAKLVRRLRGVAADIPLERRRRALYVSAYGGQLLGGTEGTSYHDVLTAAGLIDVAAERYRDWPKYDPEELLQLDPDLILTTEGSASQLCRVNGLDRLRACANAASGVLALPDSVLSNAGLGMLDAAELVRERVYGPR